MKVIKLVSIFFVSLLFFTQHAFSQANPTPVLQGRLNISIATFDCTLPPGVPGDAGELYMDTSNLFVNDKKVPIPAHVMNMLRQCPNLNFGEVTVTPLPGETNEQATERVMTEIIEKHIKKCVTPRLIEIGVRVLFDLIL